MTDSTEIVDGNEEKSVDLRKLLRAIIDSFSENDLRDLCFELRLDYENLPGQAKKDKARELVIHFDRRNRINVLVTAFREARPKVKLEEIELDELDEDPSHARIDVGSANILSPQDKSNTVIASKSFSAIVRMLSRADVRTAVVTFQTDFQAASQQIDQMNDYKQVHDLFQVLETQYDLIYRDQKRLPDDDMAWEDIAIAEPEVQTKINDIVTLSHSQTFADGDVRWAAQLEKVKERLQTAVDEDDLEALNGSVSLLHRVLNRHPTRINAQLVQVASALRLDNLEQAITTISTNLAEADVTMDKMIEEIQSGKSALSGLDERLKGLVREHNAWQNIDDEIRRVKTSISKNSIDDLEDAWYELEPMTQERIETNSEAEWAKNLTKVMGNLAPAIEKQVVTKVRRLFMRYHTYVAHRFREVDLELLSLCKELQRVGEQIDLLLRQFNK
jgi:Effector-associated domain 7